jgi:hypothetical protein
MRSVIVGIGTGDEGIEAFEPVDKPEFRELFQRPIDLQRRAKPVATEIVEDIVGASGR